MRGSLTHHQRPLRLHQKDQKSSPKSHSTLQPRHIVNSLRDAQALQRKKAVNWLEVLFTVNLGSANLNHQIVGTIVIGVEHI